MTFPNSRLGLGGMTFVKESFHSMNGRKDYVLTAKTALFGKFSGAKDSRGYVRLPEENLVPEVRMKHFEDDLRQGDGDELRMKFCALHSSAALAVNTFAFFKDRPEDLVLLGQRGFERIRFEAKLEVGFQRRPNIDVWITSENRVIAVESKFLEYLQAKEGKFREKYTRQSQPLAEECWWQAWDGGKTAGKCFSDTAQLVKHYFGLVRFMDQKPGISMTLLYLFWEPENAAETPLFRQHRAEVEALAKLVKGSRVAFQWMSYPELWNEWAKQPSLHSHVQNLRSRYLVSL